MKKKKKTFFSGKKIVLLVSVIGLYLGVAYVKPIVVSHLYASSLEDAETEKETLEEKKKETEKKLKKLENKKSNILEYIEALDTQMAEIEEEMGNLSEDMSSLETNLEETKKELESAKETEENQYELMVKRIKYMYENGNTNYLTIFFQSDSFFDMLNSAEYISKISSYDNRLFQNYLTTKQTIETEEDFLSQQLADLENLKEEYEYEKGTVEELTADKKSQVKEYNKRIKSSEKTVGEYEDAIAKQEEKIEQLLLEERDKMYALIKKRADAAGMSLEEYGELFTWPLSVKGTITSKYGPRKAPTAGASTYHKGVDIAASTGTSVLASSGGKVMIAKYSSSAGNYVMIYHGDDIYTVYMHMSKINVSVGDQVEQGDVIGLVGSTGFSTGPHLHFGLIVDGSYVNPLSYISYGSVKRVKEETGKLNE